MHIFQLWNMVCRLGACAVVFLFLKSATGHADTPLIADLSQHVVTITTGFSGSDLLLFGAVSEKESDIVVVVRGPATHRSVQQRQRTAGLWLGGQQIVFQNVPAFYHVAATRPLADIGSESLWRQQQIGLGNIEALAVVSKQQASFVADYRAALIRLYQKEGLYSQELGHIDRLGGQLFRTTLTFPNNVPVGVYSVEIYLIQQGRVVSAQTTPLRVNTIGFSAELFDFSRHYAAVYGLICIILALVVGWGGAVVMRRQ